jgi:transposase InsO family protein
MKKKKYDTSVIMLYLLKQEHLLPKEFRNSIPYSTISSWRKSNYESYEGSQFRFLFDDNWDLIKLKQENRKLRSIIICVARAYVMLKANFEDFIENQKNQKHFQAKLVSAVKSLRPHISLKVALKIFFVHRNQFYEWAEASRRNCTHSVTSLCLRRYPRQLQRKEIEKIRSILISPKYKHWPIVSIAAHALRNGSVVASLYSWYKYAKMFGLTHNSSKKTSKKVGLIAEKPNEYLHIDTTYYSLSDTKKVCITIVMDNFSKMILGFAVENRLCFNLVRSAIESAVSTISQRKGENHSYLVSDGGRENNNTQINEFISQVSDHKLNKIIALKDIQFSNSPVEAIHKIIKGRYLINKRFETLEGLVIFLRDAIYDYNYLRPHYKHYPKTPAEVYFEIDLKINFKARMAKAVKNRVKNNVATACTSCRGILVKTSPYSSPSLYHTYLPSSEIS